MKKGPYKKIKTNAFLKDIVQIGKKSRSDNRGTTKITVIVPPIDQDKFEEICFSEKREVCIEIKYK